MVMVMVMVVEIERWNDDMITCMEKLNVMNSHTGRRPAKAEPYNYYIGDGDGDGDGDGGNGDGDNTVAIPANPISVIGVSLTRSEPYLSHKPFVT